MVGDYGPAIRELAQKYSKPPKDEDSVKKNPYAFCVSLEGRMAHHLCVRIELARDVSNMLNQKGVPDSIDSHNLYWFRLDLTVGSVLRCRCPIS